MPNSVSWCHGWVAAGVALLWLGQAAVADPSAQAAASPSAPGPPRVCFVGLHGGEFGVFRRFASSAGLAVEYARDDEIRNGTADFTKCSAVYVQHFREEHVDQYLRLFRQARDANPGIRFFSISEIRGRAAEALAKAGLLEHDADLKAYHGSTAENLRRFLMFVRGRHLGGGGELPPPDKDERIEGLFHPDHAGMFATVEELLAWIRVHRPRLAAAPRAIVTAHGKHLMLQQPQVVAAIIRSFEARGVLAAAIVDYGKAYEALLREFAPGVVIHTCHSADTLELRERLGVPHMHSIFFRQQSIAEWQAGVTSLTASEMAFQVTTQELLGAIEPQIGAGTVEGGGSAESFTPIPERIDHLTARAAAWMRLGTLPNAEKKIAFLYYNREMGKSDLMRGSATGMFMNAPRSLVKILQRMRADGYAVADVPADEDDLLDRMLDHGQQIGIWAPGALDRLARSGHAVLIPVDRYLEWYGRKVPAPQREAVASRWGEAPGDFLVWEQDGRRFFVLPRVKLGNVTLLPQPLRGEAHDPSLLHDTSVPPPHNYLATYFWLQEEFGADAVVHFGTHGSEFLLPGKPVGPSQADWSDICMGAMPNINPWVINNLGESSPVRRKAYAVLIDHLVPPSVQAELSDELANLHNDIDKWVSLEAGPLKETFRDSITKQFEALDLGTDLHLELADGRLLSPAEIEKVLAYLHDIHNETTPVSLHVFGEPPPEDLLVPWLVTCLRSPFLDALGKVVAVPPGEALTPGDSRKYLRRVAEDLVGTVIRKGLAPEDALRTLGVEPPAAGLPAELLAGFVQMKKLAEGFAKTGNEIDQFMRALAGKFIPPGPGNSPDRNPGVLPTGRNMVLLNPEEVPARASWELGVRLVDEFLAEQRTSRGRLPHRVGFSLNSFATFQDYGVMEAQILHLLGVRPVWDAQNVVQDIELVPRAELGRPRVDVFISAHGYYRDMLPTRMKLLDKAIRVAAAADEPDNAVRANALRIEAELKDAGEPAERARELSFARLFGTAPGSVGSGSYYYLIERSGLWESRADLAEAYLAHQRHAYTGDLWGEPAAAAYDRQIQGTEVVLRSWSDRTRSPLSNKYTWYQGGSLCLAVKHLTGQEPEFLLSDVRDPDAARIVTAEDALRGDYRVRLFNRKWIEGMMKEGYAGADQVAVHVSNTLGWKIMRPESVQDDIFEEITNIYVRDSKRLAIREWMEAENPFAFQEITEILLEAIRKGYWNASDSTRREIAMEYARSVARHGEGGGLRGGGNTKLETFVADLLEQIDAPDVQKLVAALAARRREASLVAAPAPPGREPVDVEVAAREPAPDTAAQTVGAIADGVASQVSGVPLEPIARPAAAPAGGLAASAVRAIWLAGAAAVACFAAGFAIRRGAP